MPLAVEQIFGLPTMTFQRLGGCAQRENPQSIGCSSILVRNQTHKLIHRPVGQSELYDLKNDHQKLHNRHGQAQFSDIQRALEAQLLDWMVQTSDVRTFYRQSTFSMNSTSHFYPGAQFWLCGAGTRRKLLFRGDVLRDARTGEVLRHWPGATLHIEASQWAVRLERNGQPIARGWEDAEGVWLQEQNGEPQLLATDASGGFAPRFARFEGRAHAGWLRALWHEVVVNIVDGVPLPNLWVYDRAWHRDAAMMALVLERSGDLPLLEAWLASVESPFDRNNKGQREPDNLGQMLVVMALLDQPRHPLREQILSTLPEFTRDKHLVGLTDYAEHPVYATKWLKWGLAKLELDDAFEIPAVADSYDSLFWMAFREQSVTPPNRGHSDAYPYLTWAAAHFYGDAPPLSLMAQNAPFSWEAHASEADYARLSGIVPELQLSRCAAPHTWHAAEMFCYFWDAPTTA